MNTMKRTDLMPILAVGAGVGLLIQPILANNLPASVHVGAALRMGIFMFFLIFAPCALWIASLLARFMKGLYQFAQFAAVGTLNTFIDVGVFNLEIFLYGTSVMGAGLFAVFKAISFLVATTNSFVWNKYWTFGAKEKAVAREAAGFYSVAIIGWVLNVGVATLVKMAGPADSHIWVSIVAPFGGVAASFLWDFFGYKYLVFGKRGDTGSGADRGMPAA